MNRKSSSFARNFLCAFALLAFAAIASFPAHAQRPFKAIYQFSGPDGEGPNGNLILDASGNLYGTAPFGGLKFNRECNGGCGSVFELSPTAAGNRQRTELYRFTGRNGDGFEPWGGVVADGSGNLYGTTYQGGTNGVGTVFEISPSGGGWTETILYSFKPFGSGDGVGPSAGLVRDSLGNLYGTTQSGGSASRGAVFELSPVAGGGWSESVIYSFQGLTDGWNPESTLVLDAAGNLYGTTFGGGTTTSCGNGCGVVFELSPGISGWTESVLHAFTLNDGQTPGTTLAFDATGNLYGTTYWGGNTSEICHSGSQSGCGVVFRLAPTASGPWNSTTLYEFDSKDGASPSAIAFDAAGNLFGTTGEGGATAAGNVFRLVPTSGGGWREVVLHSFDGGTGGGGPLGLAFDASGDLLGSAGYGGSAGLGLIFEIKP